MTTHITVGQEERHEGRREATILGAAGWLALAAAPTFAGMALLTLIPSGMPDMCSSASGSSSLPGGMGTMYLLMSVFHSTPWLRLVSGR